MPRTKAYEAALAQWRDVVGFEGAYRVARDGRVMRVAPGRHSGIGRLLSPEHRIVSLSYQGKNRHVSRAVLVREAFGDEALVRIPNGANPKIGFQPMRPNKCWCWDILVEMMADGPLHTTAAAQRLYGSTDLASRQAAAMLMGDLTGTSTYAGGPYLVRVARGWYALADRKPARTTRDQMLQDILTYRPRTHLSIQAHLGASKSTVDKLLQKLRKRGLLRSEIAPSRYWSGKGPRSGWVRWYWLGKRARERMNVG